MDVTDVLRDRMHEPGGLEGMALLSIAGHVAIVAAIVLAPGFVRGRPVEAPATVMTISLGGAPPGQKVEGMTPEGAKPVQEAVAPQPGVKEPQRAPAAKTPEMTLPEKNAKPAKTPSAVVKQAPDNARGRTPTRGAETREGTATGETGVRGQGFGLTTGGAGLGQGSFLDVSDFCCPEYLVTMKQRIESNWNPHAGASGTVLVRFTIQRNGQVVNVGLEESSGNSILDLNAEKAIYSARQLPPLPAQFPNATLTVHLNFIYQ